MLFVASVSFVGGIFVPGGDDWRVVEILLVRSSLIKGGLVDVPVP